MPKYKVPAEKFDMAVSASKRNKGHQPTVYVPMKPEWLTKLKLGQKLSIEIKGKVSGIESHERENHSRHEVQIEVEEVQYYGKKEAEVAEVFNTGEEDE